MKKNCIKTAVLLLTVLFAGLFFISCDEKEDNYRRKLSSTVLEYTECRHFFTDDDDGTLERLEYYVKGDELFITRYNVMYNCCGNELKVAVRITDDTVFVKESDSGECDCICQRDVQYKISGIPKGHYIVSICGRSETFDITVK